MSRWEKGTWQMVLRNMSKEDMWGLLFEMAEKDSALQEKIRSDFSVGKYTDAAVDSHNQFVKTAFKDCYPGCPLNRREGERLEKCIADFMRQHVSFFLKRSGPLEAFSIFRGLISPLYFVSFDSLEQEASILDKMIDFLEGILQKAGPEEKEVMHRWFYLSENFWTRIPQWLPFLTGCWLRKWATNLPFPDDWTGCLEKSGHPSADIMWISLNIPKICWKR